MDTPILKMLNQYHQQHRERWHTPGHKGTTPPGGDFLDWSFDITEIGPMHHHPNPVEQSERLMAETFGARRTWYSVQGATLPVMAAVLAANPPGSTLLVDRSMHRSVLGALMIGGYHVRWLWPRMVTGGLTLPLQQFPEDYEGISGVVLCRPTYDGLAAPLGEVVDRAHRQGATVIVDEAHGSHWRGSNFPTSALGQGGDLVIHGVHKSEAALTQTGLLHLSGDRVEEAACTRWMRMLSTSSPSYLLLASLDRLQWERHQPEYGDTWDTFADRMKELWHRLEKRGIGVLQSWAVRQGLEADPARLTLRAGGDGWQARFARIGEWEKTSPGTATFFLAPHQDLTRLFDVVDELPQTAGVTDWRLLSMPRLDTAITVRETWGRKTRSVPVQEAEGVVLAEALTPYPPGVPAAVPGEVLSAEMRDWLLWWYGSGGGSIEGLWQEDGQLWLSALA